MDIRFCSITRQRPPFLSGRLPVVLHDVIACANVIGIVPDRRDSVVPTSEADFLLFSNKG